MAAGFSDAARDDTLTYWFTANAVTITRPTAWYVSLYKGDPYAGGTEVDSGADDNQYARQTVAFSTSGTGTMDNDGAVVFPAVQTGASPYAVAFFGIHDAVSGGNLITAGPLTSTVTRNADETLTIAAGDIDLSEART